MSEDDSETLSLEDAQQYYRESAMDYKQLTAIIHKEDDIYVSLCPELDIASQGLNIDEAKDNLKEAVELFFECASPEEINQRYNGETYISSMEIAFG